VEDFRFYNELDYGAAINFLGANLIINNTVARSNNGLKGGFLMIDSPLSETRTVTIDNSNFNRNSARNGPAIYIGEYVKDFLLVMRKNYFHQNYGWGMMIFSILIWKLKIDGGVGFFKAGNENCTFLLENNVFLQNNGIIGGSLFFELDFGIAFLFDNIFIENKATTMVGLGGCFAFYGIRISTLNVVGNKIFLHFSEYLGTIAQSGGRLEMSGNIFYG
jgi:hypothetical protein